MNQIPNHTECFIIDETGTRRLMTDNEYVAHQKGVEESQKQIKEMCIAQRNGALTASDWVVQRSMELGQPIPEEWKIYRQALRDLTSQPNFPNDVVWPDAPKAKQ